MTCEEGWIPNTDTSIQIFSTNSRNLILIFDNVWIYTKKDILKVILTKIDMQGVFFINTKAMLYGNR